MVESKKLNTLLALGLVLIGIFIIIISWRETGFLRIIGVLGGVITTFVELVFFIQRLSRWGK